MREDFGWGLFLQFPESQSGDRKNMNVYMIRRIRKQMSYFQWPDGASQEVGLTKGEWAGPIVPPSED